MSLEGREAVPNSFLLSSSLPTNGWHEWEGGRGGTLAGLVSCYNGRTRMIASPVGQMGSHPILSPLSAEE